jgi:hypothetical protein
MCASGASHGDAIDRAIRDSRRNAPPLIAMAHTFKRSNLTPHSLSLDASDFGTLTQLTQLLGRPLTLTRQ